MNNELRLNQTNGEVSKKLSPPSLSPNHNRILCEEARSPSFLVGSVGHQVRSFDSYHMVTCFLALLIHFSESLT